MATQEEIAGVLKAVRTAVGLKALSELDDEAFGFQVMGFCAALAFATGDTTDRHLTALTKNIGLWSKAALEKHIDSYRTN